MRTGLLLAGGLAVAVAGCSAGADRSLAEGGVAEFRQLRDAGRYAQIWQNSAPDLRSTIAEVQFVQTLGATHSFYGNFRSAEQTNWHWNSNNGSVFVTLEYDTQYERARGAERFVYRIESGAARLAGYHINAPGTAPPGNTTQ